MSKTNSVKRNQPITHCIFCGVENPTSEEHILPAWVYRALDKAQIPYNKISKYSHITLSEVVTDELHVKSDDATSPILCEKCNHSWSGNIQNDAASILTPVIQGEWKPLNKKQIAKILRWFSCYLMVREMIHDSHESHSQQARTDLRFKGLFPRSLNVWIGQLNLTDLNTILRGLRSQEKDDKWYRMQISVSTIGHFIIISYGALPNGRSGVETQAYINVCNFLDTLGFAQIMKFNRVFTESVIDPPLLNEYAGVYAMCDAITETLFNGYETYQIFDMHQPARMMWA